MKFAPTDGKPRNRILVPFDFREIIRHVRDECPLASGQAVAWWPNAMEPRELAAIPHEARSGGRPSRARHRHPASFAERMYAIRAKIAVVAADRVFDRCSG
jgi:hypothetical protein